MTLSTLPADTQERRRRNATSRVLLAVVAVWAKSPTVTVRAVAAEAGLAFGYTHTLLTDLREAGLVGWTDGKRSSLHPLVLPVTFG